MKTISQVRTALRVLLFLFVYVRVAHFAHAQIKSDDDLRMFVSGLTISRIYAGFDAISKWALIIGLFIAVIAYASAGIAFFTSRGDPERLATAKKTATYATWGTVLIVLARSIVVLIGNFFG